MATPTKIQHVSTSPNRVGNVSSGGTYNIPLPNNSLAGNCLICAWTFGGNSSPVTVTDNKGNSWSTPITVFDATNSQTLAISFALDCAAGTNLIQINAGGGAGLGFVMAHVTEFNNIALTSAADGSTTNGATSASVTAGSFTPTTNGDLLYQAAFNSANASVPSWTKGSSPWSFADAQDSEGFATQWQVQATAGAINPTMTQGSSAAFISVAIALKSASAGTAMPGGIFVTKIHHVNTQNETATSFVFQAPTTIENLICIGYGSGNNYEPSGITDSQGNTWTLIGNATIGTSGLITNVALWYAIISSPSEQLTITVTMSGSDPTGNGSTFMLYEMTGADPTAPLDRGYATSGFASATGQQATGTGGNVTTYTATPSLANCVAVGAGSIDFDTATGWASPTGAVFTGVTYTGEVNPTNSDENNPWGLYYNGASLAPQVWTFTHDASDSAGVGFWAYAGANFSGPIVPTFNTGVQQDPTYGELAATQPVLGGIY